MPVRGQKQPPRNVREKTSLAQIIGSDGEGGHLSDQMDESMNIAQPAGIAALK
jgi:hypothetical protein